MTLSINLIRDFMGKSPAAEEKIVTIWKNISNYVWHPTKKRKETYIKYKHNIKSFLCEFLCETKILQFCGIHQEVLANFISFSSIATVNKMKDKTFSTNNFVPIKSVIFQPSMKPKPCKLLSFLSTINNNPL